jgi:hypothetical protein
LSIVNAINAAKYPNNGVSLYVSKLNGNDANTGSIFSQLASMNAAHALARSLPATYFFINVTDAETYDEAQVLDYPVNIYAPAATFQTIAASGDCMTLTGSGVVVYASVIQSTAGNAVTVNGGYPILGFNASFAGNFVANSGAGYVTINANTIFGSVSNPGFAGGTRTILNLSTPIGGSVDAYTFAPWSNSLTPF